MITFIKRWWQRRRDHRQAARQLAAFWSEY